MGALLLCPHDSQAVICFSKGGEIHMNAKKGLGKLLSILGSGVAITGLAITFSLINVEEINVNINNKGTGAVTLAPSTETNFMTATQTVMPATPTATPAIMSNTNNNDEELDVNIFIKAYLSAMTSAINNSNFNYVSDFLYNKSKAYSEQKTYIEEYCQQHEIKETVVSVDIISEKKSKNKVIIDTRETYDITSKVNGKRTTSLLTSYSIDKINGTWLITKIINKTSENLEN